MPLDIISRTALHTGQELQYNTVLNENLPECNLNQLSIVFADIQNTSTTGVASSADVVSSPESKATFDSFQSAEPSRTTEAASFNLTSHSCGTSHLEAQQHDIFLPMDEVEQGTRRKTVTQDFSSSENENVCSATDNEKVQPTSFTAASNIDEVVTGKAPSSSSRVPKKGLKL